MSSVCGHVLHGRQGMNVMTVYIMLVSCLYYLAAVAFGVAQGARLYPC